MKNLLWFLFGIVGGFVAAHVLNKDPRGHELLAEVDSRINAFTDLVSDSYREQEARFSGIVGDAATAASDVFDSAKDAATDAVDAARDAAEKLTD